MDKTKILVLNAGSSSLKASLFSQDEGKLTCLWSAGKSVDLASCDAKQVDALFDQWLFLESGIADDTGAVALVGHRVVHGGSRFSRSVRIDSSCLVQIEQLCEIAPLHNPIALKVLYAARRKLPEPAAKHVAVFDTAFHSTISDECKIYPLPYEWYAGKDLRRFGFHGISHQYCARRAAEIAGVDLKSTRIITCHLGNGCSLAAVRHGISCDTTMGYTPLDGLMMGTRCGSVDPGLLLHMLTAEKITAEELQTVLNKKSGLLGVSGRSADMRSIESAMLEGDKRAKLAFDMFVYRLSAGISTMAASMSGVDVVAFTGGIGEHSQRVRQSACARLRFLGLEMNENKNENCHSDCGIYEDSSPVKIVVIEAREDLEIARECLLLPDGATNLGD